MLLGLGLGQRLSRVPIWLQAFRPDFYYPGISLGRALVALTVSSREALARVLRWRLSVLLCSHGLVGVGDLRRRLGVLVRLRWLIRAGRVLRSARRGLWRVAILCRGCRFLGFGGIARLLRVARTVRCMPRALLAGRTVRQVVVRIIRSSARILPFVWRLHIAGPLRRGVIGPATHGEIIAVRWVGCWICWALRLVRWLVSRAFPR